MYKCSLCELKFEKFQSRSNHIRWHHNRLKNDTPEFRSNLKKAKSKVDDNKFGKLITETVNCSNIKGCPNKVVIKYRGKKPKVSHCSRSCANIRPKNSWTPERYELHMKRFNDPNDSYGEVLDRWYGSSSLLKPTPQISKDFKGMYFEEIEVDVISLDEYYNTLPADQKRIDFIWADIQGAEKMLIEGGQIGLEHTRYFYTEYNNAVHYEGQAVGLQEILDMLPNFEVVEDYGGDVLLKNKNI